MQKFLKNIRLWLPTIVILLLAAFTIVRMQTVQAALCKQIESKVNKEVYRAGRVDLMRELDHIRDDLKRIEEKLDDVIIRTGKKDPGNGGN